MDRIQIYLAKSAAEEKAKDVLHGGQADGIPASHFKKDEYKAGLKEEMEEHTNSKQIASEIVRDHLKKDPHYYSALESFEKTRKPIDFADRLRKMKIRRQGTAEQNRHE
jgi:hypothetical protein